MPKTDAQGHSTVVEWQLNNQFGQERGFHMKVTDSPVCMNFWLCNGETAGKCKRFDTLTKLLAEQPVNTPEDVLHNLEAASVKNTEWSCVYRLSDFSVEVALDNQYGEVYHFSPDVFQ